MVLKKIEETEKNPAPHKLGINPPRVEPINTKIQISDLEFM